jgi:4-hydroxy-tetrahydrodipicolinate reductase
MIIAPRDDVKLRPHRLHDKGTTMPIHVCVAGATGWTGSLVTQQILASGDFQLAGAIARRHAGQDVGEVLGLPPAGVTIAPDLDVALRAQADVLPDVLIDYTGPTSVKERTLAALDHGVRVVIGTSGLAAADFDQIARRAEVRGLGVIAAGNFSITAALAKHFALLAARFLPSWEIIDYASAGKPDAPSGTTRELAEALAEVAHNKLEVAIGDTLGAKDARGATIGGAQVHSLRLPSYTIAFETIFGLPDERLTIRHDSGMGAEPYVAGTLLATRRVMAITGLVRGLDTLLFAG